MAEKNRLNGLDLFEIWGEERIRSFLRDVTSDPESLARLARVKFGREPEVEEAVHELLSCDDPEEQQLLAISLPETIQEVIILDCVMELNKAIRRAIHDLN